MKFEVFSAVQRKLDIHFARGKKKKESSRYTVSLDSVHSFSVLVWNSISHHFPRSQSVAWLQQWAAMCGESLPALVVLCCCFRRRAVT